MLPWWKIQRPRATRDLINHAFNKTFITLSEGEHPEFGFLNRSPNSPWKLVKPKKTTTITWKL
jgi:hypothetical protein